MITFRTKNLDHLASLRRIKKCCENPFFMLQIFKMSLEYDHKISTISPRYQPSPQDINHLPKISTINPRYQPSAQDINHQPKISTIYPWYQPSTQGSTQWVRAQARLSPGPSIFIGIGLEILRRAQARPRLGKAWDQFFEKGPENWDFYVVKKEARQGSGLNFCEGPGLGLGSRSIFKAQDWPGINLLGLDPSLPKISTIYPRYQPSTQDINHLIEYVNWSYPLASTSWWFN